MSFREDHKDDTVYLPFDEYMELLDLIREQAKRNKEIKGELEGMWEHVRNLESRLLAPYQYKRDNDF